VVRVTNWMACASMKVIWSLIHSWPGAHCGYSRGKSSTMREPEEKGKYSSIVRGDCQLLEQIE
jgi:hypothetical protein